MNMPLWIKKSALIFLVALLVMAAAYAVYFQVEGRHVVERRAIEQSILRMPVAELAVYDFTFEIISRATRTEAGNTAVMVLSAGLMGKGTSTAILYRGCVSVRYGVDLASLASSPWRYSIHPDSIDIRLPEPGPIGKPRVLSSGPCASEVLDVYARKSFLKPETWFDDPVTLDLQKLLREEYQALAPGWASRFGLDALSRERTREVMSVFLAPVARGRKINISFDEEATQPQTSGGPANSTSGGRP